MRVVDTVFPYLVMKGKGLSSKDNGAFSHEFAVREEGAYWEGAMEKLSQELSILSKGRETQVWLRGEIRDSGKLIYSEIDLENKNRTKSQEESEFSRTLEGCQGGKTMGRGKDQMGKEEAQRSMGMRVAERIGE